MKANTTSFAGIAMFLWAICLGVAFGFREPLADQGIYWVFVALAVAPVYLLPLGIARFRKHRNLPALAALNLFGGWTVLGWIAALVWSLYRAPK
jgi:heme A synthase